MFLDFYVAALFNLGSMLRPIHRASLATPDTYCMLHLAAILDMHKMRCWKCFKMWMFAQQNLQSYLLNYDCFVLGNLFIHNYFVSRAIVKDSHGCINLSKSVENILLLQGQKDESSQFICSCWKYPCCAKRWKICHALHGQVWSEIRQVRSWTENSSTTLYMGLWLNWWECSFHEINSFRK